jgi:very-short-patch-repair endonuclease
VAVTDAVIARLAGRQHGAVARWQLNALGISDDAIACRARDERLRRLFRGVYVVGTAPTPRRTRWMAAVLACGEEALLSHWDAAGLWDLWGGDRTRVHVTVGGGSRRRRAGLVVHRSGIWHPDDRDTIAGIPVTSLSRTLLDLAELASATELQRVYEAAAKRALVDLRAIERLLARSNGRRGAGRLRVLLDYDPTAAAQAKSELERLFLDLVRRAGLPTPQVNVLVEGYEVDAYWPEARLVVELQSYEHHSDRETFKRDHVRGARLKLVGYEFLPLTYSQVTDGARASAATVRTLLVRGGGRSGSSKP